MDSLGYQYLSNGPYEGYILGALKHHQRGAFANMRPTGSGEEEMAVANRQALAYFLLGYYEELFNG